MIWGVAEWNMWLVKVLNQSSFSTPLMSCKDMGVKFNWHKRFPTWQRWIDPIYEAQQLAIKICLNIYWNSYKCGSLPTQSIGYIKLAINFIFFMRSHWHKVKPTTESKIQGCDSVPEKASINCFAGYLKRACVILIWLKWHFLFPDIDKRKKHNSPQTIEWTPLD